MNRQPRGVAVRKRVAWHRRELWPLAVIAFGNACGIRVVEPNARGTAVSELGSGVVAATPVRTAPASDDAVTRIDVALAYKRWEAKTAIFIDTRGAEAYHSGCIAGARSMPLAEIDVDPRRALQTLPRDKLAIFYCT